MPRILILDDERPLLQSLSLELGRVGHETVLTECGREAMKALEKGSPDLAILDLQLPDMSGLEVLRCLKAELPEVPVVVITAFASVDTAVEAIKEGAADYLEKPLDLEEVLIVVERELQNAQLRCEVEAYRRERRRDFAQHPIVGESFAMEQLCRTIEQLAQVPFDRVSELPGVLIQGETGTGKDLVARTLHDRSPLAARPFVQVNCSGLPRDLVESELFGHEKGSFTGATQRKQGLFEVAQGGTIFLDEIGDMPLDIQAKLLLAIEKRTLRRVGGTREHNVDVRIIAATNRDLEDAVRRGEFRSDLYYRLRVVNLTIPPLRERRDDIPPLVEFFLQQFRRRYRKPDFHVDSATMDRLIAWDWPGNVRELGHTLEQMVLLGTTTGVSDLTRFSVEPIGASAVAASAVDAAQPTFDFVQQDCSLEGVERRLIDEALHFTRGNVSEVARILRVSRGALRHRIDKWGIDTLRQFRGTERAVEA